MSTRAVYRFVKEDGINVYTDIYKHHDGYPSGAVLWIQNAIDYEKKQRENLFEDHSGDSYPDRRLHYADRLAISFLLGNTGFRQFTDPEINSDAAFIYTIRVSYQDIQNINIVWCDFENENQWDGTFEEMCEVYKNVRGEKTA